MEVEDQKSAGDMTDGGFGGTFDCKALQEHLQRCVLEDSGHVSMDEYIEVFKQLYKFFCMLGTVFGFVGSDVKAKVEILSTYRQGPKRDEYITVEKMLEYEVTSGLITANKEGSAARTFLRLHRSLVFVSQFLDKSLQIKDEEGTHHICKTAYDGTLAKFHPWVIKKGAHLAMYTLPTKKDLFSKVCGDHVQNSEVDALVKEVTERTQSIYGKCETLYSDKNLLTLP